MFFLIQRWQFRVTFADEKFSHFSLLLLLFRYFIAIDDDSFFGSDLFSLYLEAGRRFDVFSCEANCFFACLLKFWFRQSVIQETKQLRTLDWVNYFYLALCFHLWLNCLYTKFELGEVGFLKQCSRTVSFVGRNLEAKSYEIFQTFTVIIRYFLVFAWSDCLKKSREVFGSEGRH